MIHPRTWSDGPKFPQGTSFNDKGRFLTPFPYFATSWLHMTSGQIRHKSDKSDIRTSWYILNTSWCIVSLKCHAAPLLWFWPCADFWCWPCRMKWNRQLKWSWQSTLPMELPAKRPKNYNVIQCVNCECSALGLSMAIKEREHGIGQGILGKSANINKCHQMSMLMVNPLFNPLFNRSAQSNFLKASGHIDCRRPI